MRRRRTTDEPDSVAVFAVCAFICLFWPICTKQSIRADLRRYSAPYAKDGPHDVWAAAGHVDGLVRQMYIQCRYMATSTQIAKWGNSLGLRLPKAVALEARVDEGDTVEVSVKNGAIVIRRGHPTYSLDRLVAKITPRNRHKESDWGAPAGRELW